MILPFRSWIVSLTIAVLLVTGSARADPLYNVTPLSAPGWEQPLVDGLSNSGQVLLWNPWASGGAPISMLYNGQAGGTITSLDTTGGVATPNLFVPLSLNSSGQIIAELNSLEYVVVNNGQVTQVPGQAMAVSGNGQIAYEGATIQNGVLNQSTYILNNGVNTNLGVVSGYMETAVDGLNNAGQAAATAVNYGGLTTSQPLFYNGQTLIPLGTFGGPKGYSTAINSSGDIVGSAMNSSGVYVGFVSHAGGPLISLGTLPGGVEVTPRSINDSGQIVGYSGTINYVSAQTTGAFLYQSGVLTNLNTLLAPSASNINLVDAYAINDAGQIVAKGYIKGQDPGLAQIFLLTPEGEPMPASPDPLIQTLPEPSTLVMFGLILAGTAAHRWRRRSAGSSSASRR